MDSAHPRGPYFTGRGRSVQHVQGIYCSSEADLSFWFLWKISACVSGLYVWRKLVLKEWIFTVFAKKNHLIEASVAVINNERWSIPLLFFCNGNAKLLQSPHLTVYKTAWISNSWLVIINCSHSFKCIEWLFWSHLKFEVGLNVFY